jgi:hypothetical protein
MPYIDKHNSCYRKKVKSEKGEYQLVQQAKYYERNATMSHTPTVAGITGMVLGWITLSMTT